MKDIFVNVIVQSNELNMYYNLKSHFSIFSCIKPRLSMVIHISKHGIFHWCLAYRRKRQKDFSLLIIYNYTVRSQLSTQASSITSSKYLIDIVHDLFAQHYIQSCATISLPQLQVCPTLSDGIGDWNSEAYFPETLSSFFSSHPDIIKYDNHHRVEIYLKHKRLATQNNHMYVFFILRFCLSTSSKSTSPIKAGLATRWVCTVNILYTLWKILRS